MEGEIVELGVAVHFVLEHAACLPQSVEIAELGVAVHLAVEHAACLPPSVVIGAVVVAVQFVVDRAASLRQLVESGTLAEAVYGVDFSSSIAAAFHECAADVAMMLFFPSAAANDAVDFPLPQWHWVQEYSSAQQVVS